MDHRSFRFHATRRGPMNRTHACLPKPRLSLRSRAWAAGQEPGWGGLGGVEPWVLGMKARAGGSTFCPSLPPLPLPLLPSPALRSGSVAQSVSGCPARVVGGEDSGSVLTRRWPEAQGPPAPPSQSTSVTPQPRAGPHTLGHGFPLPKDEPQTGGEVGGGECKPAPPWPASRPGPPWGERLTLAAAPPNSSRPAGVGGGEGGEVREKVGNSRGRD